MFWCSVPVSVHGSRPAKMRGGRQAACRHGPARHFSLNTLFFISFQPTNLASTPPPSLILDTTHITKVTLRESPRVTPYTFLHCRQHPMFPHERKLQQLQQQRQLVEQLRREAAINRINVSQVRVSSSHPSTETWQQLVAVIYLGSPPVLGLEKNECKQFQNR